MSTTDALSVSHVSGVSDVEAGLEENRNCMTFSKLGCSSRNPALLIRQINEERHVVLWRQ
jgi:hypothetical protein